MRRRVVHLRIKSKIVHGCFMLQKEQGLHPEHKKMSTVVTEVLEGCVMSLARKGQISLLDDEEADRALSHWLIETAGPGEMSLDIDIDSFGPASDPDEDEDEIEVEYLSPQELERRGKAIVGTVARVASEPSVEEMFREEDEDEDEGEPIPLSEIPPWEQEGIRSMENIKEEVSKSDLLYQRILNNEDSTEAYQKALQVVYSKIPKELWGTDRAESLINNLVPFVQRHIDARKPGA